MNSRKFATVAAATLVLGASSAFAGEITGNGKWIAGSPDAPLNGRSECAYSGQQDDALEPGYKGKNNTQSWGQILPSLKVVLISLGLHPGLSCNPVK